MQLTDHARLPVLEQLLAERALGRQLAQAQQANEDVGLGILVRQERLPPAVGRVVAADELELVGLREGERGRVRSRSRSTTATRRKERWRTRTRL